MERTWTNIRRAIALVLQAAPGWMSISLALAFLQAAIPLATLFCLKVLIDRLTQLIAAGDDSFRPLIGILLLTVSLALLNDFARGLATYVTSILAERVGDHVYEQLHARSIAVDLSYYEHPDFHHTLHRAQREAAYRPARVLESLLQLGRSTLFLVGVAAVLTTLHWAVTFALLVATLPGLLIRLRSVGKHFLRRRKWTVSDRLAWYFHELMTTSHYAKEVRLLNLGTWLQGRFDSYRNQVREEKLAFARQRSAMEIVTQGSSSLAMIGSFAWASSEALAGRITLGALILYFQAFQRGQASLRELMAGLAGVYENSLFLSDYHEFLALEPKVPEPSHPQPAGPPRGEGIRFEGVGFQYPHSTRGALSGVNLQLRPGELVALVGSNGAGKTTLIKLLCRLYDPTQGRITVDGVDLRQFTTADWRQQVDVLFQDHARYNMTVRENIGLGSAEPDRPAMEAAARAVGVDGLIGRLPDGYDSVLGTEYLEGEELSGGEWQKLALARVFLRASPVLVLDEPTSALDPEAEAEVLQKFHELARGRTAIVISHRLAFARRVDRIIVLDDGHIVEEGRHEELMRRGGRYAHMFALQAERYMGT